MSVVSGEPEAPEIVCLCGSTRFHREYQIANFDETMAGRIVLTVGFYPYSDEHHETVGLTNAGYAVEVKEGLDELHKRKIDLAGSVLVISPRRFVDGRLQETNPLVWLTGRSDLTDAGWKVTHMHLSGAIQIVEN